jgi:hypothetical protein
MLGGGPPRELTRLGEWPNDGNDPRGARSSSLAQIDRALRTKMGNSVVASALP